MDACIWKDKLLEEQLKNICDELFENGHITGTQISFFTEFKTEEILYRADPFFMFQMSLGMIGHKSKEQIVKKMFQQNC